ncbi:hypothetical protein FACS189465_0840 [Clostridia bacterium]|nr:hypothetical protein FACS189465_0840 [Clostridia bacterium]
MFILEDKEFELLELKLGDSELELELEDEGLELLESKDEALGLFGVRLLDGEKFELGKK